jgi:hypothetical protein
MNFKKFFSVAICFGVIASSATFAMYRLPVSTTQSFAQSATQAARQAAGYGQGAVSGQLAMPEVTPLSPELVKQAQEEFMREYQPAWPVQSRVAPVAVPQSGMFRSTAPRLISGRRTYRQEDQQGSEDKGSWRMGTGTKIGLGLGAWGASAFISDEIERYRNTYAEETPLMHAVRLGDLDEVEALIKNGANVNARYQNKSVFTMALDAALNAALNATALDTISNLTFKKRKKAFVEILEVLLAAEAKIELKDINTLIDAHKDLKSRRDSSDDGSLKIFSEIEYVKIARAVSAVLLGVEKDDLYKIQDYKAFIYAIDSSKLSFKSEKNKLFLIKLADLLLSMDLLSLL